MDGVHAAGGSLQLAQLIDEGHGAAIRYDLQHLGLDLADVWRGTLAPRRVLELVEHSPDDSALTARLRGGGQHRAWSLHTHLLAAIVDAVNGAAWTTAQVNSKKRLAKPKQVPRPKDGVNETQPRRRLDLSNHPAARPLPEKYLKQLTS